MKRRASREKALFADMSSPVTFLVVLLGCVLLASAGGTWDYGEEYGPETWADTYPDCGGRRQSPVDLSDTALTGSPHFSWHGYEEVPASMALTNNGHTVVLSSVSPHPRLVKSDGRIFQLDAVHFHWGKEDHEGSEHTVEGRRFALEMHAVHRRVYENGSLVTPSDIIVLASLFEHTSFNLFGDVALDKFIHHFESVEEPETSTPVEPFSWLELLHHFTHDFYWYEGSLTTPPCSEVVTFYVPRHDRKVSSEQMSQFRKLLNHENQQISGNFRPTQKKNGRKVNFKV